MLTLFCTICSTDYKGRPNHTLQILGHGSYDELKLLMENDIAKWQAEDRKADKEEIDEDDEEELPDYGPDGWSIDGVRWEMDIGPPTPARTVQREFTYDNEDVTSSIVYHIMNNTVDGN